jgi:hypothetical protein
MEKARNTEEMNDEGQITDVTVTGHFNNLNKHRSKDTLSTDRYDNINAFKVTLQLRENEMELRNLLHFHT